MTTRSITVAEGADLSGFRRALRSLIAAGVPPEEVSWQVATEPGLFGADAVAPAPPVSLPRRLGELIETVVCHSDPERYALLYRLAWRVTHGERVLLEMAADPDVHRLALMEQSVRRDIHKMHADPLKAVADVAKQEPRSLEELNRMIAASEPLVPGPTRAVLGEGPIGAAIAFVGEQPGDQEDLQGRPFVGPAGHLLNCALAEAKIDRDRAYLTNAVKHFKFERRGKKRIHQTPTAGEVKHYRWWLLKELDFVRPKLVVALGATAALALFGKPVAVGRMRGETRFGERAGFITLHPSYLLRLPDEGEREAARHAFVADLVRIRELAGGAPTAVEDGMMRRGLVL